MPIEIRELIIRAEVAPSDDTPNHKAPNKERVSPPATISAEDVARLLRELKER